MSIAVEKSVWKTVWKIACYTRYPCCILRVREATREKGEKGETKPHALKPKGCDLIKQQRYTRIANIYGIYAVHI